MGSALTWNCDETELATTVRRHTLLLLATFGLYRFWSRTELRRRAFAAIRIDAIPLRYTGTARDLLMPFLAALAGLVAVAIALLIAKWLAVPRPRVSPSPWRFVISLPAIYVLGLAAWRARDYLVSSIWLGSRPGQLDGNRFHYAGVHLGTAIMMPLTLGLALPFRQVWLQRRLVEPMSVGIHRFSFDAQPVSLLKRFAGVWAGGIVIYLSVVLSLAKTMGPKILAAKGAGEFPSLDATEVGIVMALALSAALAFTTLAAWYRIGVLRHFAAATRLDGRPVRLEASTGAYVRLTLGNALMRLVSLGALSPIAELRTWRFLAAHLWLARPLTSFSTSRDSSNS